MRPFLGLLFLATLMFQSCSDPTTKNRLVLSGSSTLSALGNLVVQRWSEGKPRGDFRVEAIGSDAGLERLLRYRDADLALVSRPLNDQDRTLAAQSKLTMLAFPIARDAVVLVVPVGNHWAKSMTKDQAALALTSATLWSDVDPHWPQTPIHRFVLGPESGTAAVLTGGLLRGDRKSLYSGPGTQSSEDDQIVSRGISQVDGAFGFLGWTTFRGTGESLRAISLDGVLPSPATISQQSYSLTRPLWLVTTRESLDQNSNALGIVRYLYDHYEELTRESGLVPLTHAELDRVRGQLP